MSYQNGVLLNSSPFIVNAANNSIPTTVSLSSAATTRKIEVSIDGGVNWLSIPYTSAVVGAISLVANAPISHVRLTGSTGDAWSMRS